MTSIQITRETKARLARLGKKGETYESIIIWLMDSIDAVFEGSQEMHACITGDYRPEKPKKKPKT